MFILIDLYHKVDCSWDWILAATNSAPSFQLTDCLMRLPVRMSKLDTFSSAPTMSQSTGYYGGAMNRNSACLRALNAMKLVKQSS